MFTLLLMMLAAGGGFYAAKKTSLIATGAKAGNSALGLLGKLFQKK
jgi:hypothetical protein